MFCSSVILLSFTLIFEANADCRESYVTICDKYSDVIDPRRKVNNVNAHKWTQLIIGSEQTLNNTNVTLAEFAIFPFLDFPKLRSLTILGGQIKLYVQPSLSCFFQNDLEMLNLYGHHIGKLKWNLLPAMNVKQLILRNNGITFLEKFSLYNFGSEFLDLSDNSIEEIREKTMPVRGNKTKYIKIENNKLSFIDKNAFPSTVRVLNLDNNNLRSLSREVFENLIDLEEITLGRNKIFSLPWLENSKNLRVLDLSHNGLEHLDRNSFEGFEKLASLDLTNNLLKYSESEDTHFLNFILKTPKVKDVRISVAFNRLVRLPVDYLNSTISPSYASIISNKFDKRGYELYLYGNPWNCKYYRENEKFFTNATNICDTTFFNSGETPVCFDYNQFYFLDVSLNEDVINPFLAAAKPEKYYKECDMSAHRAYVTYTSNNRQTQGCVA